METTDGISRGTEVVATGAPIKMPTGENIKGRVFNVVGDAIDGMENLDRTDGLPIHREAPKFEDLSTSTEVLFTGIKVIDLIEPYAKGGKIGLLGVQVLEKQYLFKNLSITLLRDTEDYQYLLELEKELEKEMTC